MKRRLWFTGLGRIICIAAIVFASVAFIGCWVPDKLQHGTFGDIPVSGVNFKSASRSGVTGQDGAFDYAANETVTFSIGALSLGAAAGAATLTPLDIISGATDAGDQRVNNLLVLLQTLDADGDLNNGIQITSAIRDIVSGSAASINLDQTTAGFATSLAGLMTDLNDAKVFTDTYRGARTIRKASVALALFKRNVGTRISVTTRNGRLNGYEANADTWQWLGVPYSKAPVNDLRWRPPKAAKSWTGVRQATEWGDQAAQPLAYAAAAFGGVSEDCLNLNITAPKGAKSLPVMVWFHGGAFGILTANTSAYNNPAALTTKGVVLVTVNHRLGAFGYLAHPELTAESSYGGSGNYGQMDLMKALQWVRDNIAAFGGNPRNVTIFGQSGGGGKAISLMASPLATGLFHKVICESGMAASTDATLNAGTLAAAEAKGISLATRLGGLTIAQMREVPWLDIINADLSAFGDRAWLVYSPNIDNYYSIDTMENMIKDGLPSDVPFLAGANAFDRVAGVDLAPGVTQQMPWRADNNNAEQYVYHWSYVPPGWAAMNVGAYHGLELIYVFNSSIPSFIAHFNFGLVLDKTTGLSPTIPTITGDPNTDLLISTGYYSPAPPYPSAESKALSDKAMSIWTNFAKTGNPSVPGVIDNWPRYTSDSDAFVEIGAGATFTPATGIAATFGMVEE
ncbi:MAG: carboxylesterase family protein [Desulfobacteraceae bacterium]|nr:carboxylesterase family protein [Desulfobacteraceae bacterium]